MLHLKSLAPRASVASQSRCLSLIAESMKATGKSFSM